MKYTSIIAFIGVSMHINLVNKNPYQLRVFHGMITISLKTMTPKSATIWVTTPLPERAPQKPTKWRMKTLRIPPKLLMQFINHRDHLLTIMMTLDPSTMPTGNASARSAQMTTGVIRDHMPAEHKAFGFTPLTSIFKREKNKTNLE